MRTFYILHYSNKDGSKESIVITEEEVTPELIDENCPYEQTFDRAIECETSSNDLGLLPLDYEMQKH